MARKLHVIGYACGLAGLDRETAKGPLCLQSSPLIDGLANRIFFNTIIHEPGSSKAIRVDESLNMICSKLAKEISDLIQKGEPFSVVGGDHSSAIGTWSGVYDAIHKKGDFGLIWIDAHMDSHTPETTESGRIHGMGLACLMGYGYPTLTGILNYSPKLKPENVILIGVRSYEAGEADLLKRLNVRTYFIEEVKERGINIVLQEAVDNLKKRTVGYGLSIDLDALDPDAIPGVDVPEKNGVEPNAFSEAIASLASDPKLIGTEIIEFNPSRDIDHKTEKFVVKLLDILAQKK